MPTDRPRVAVVGATGRTGRLILDAGRASFAFRVIGRNDGALSALARSLGDDAEWRTVAGLEHDAVAAAVGGSAIVINVAGPFTATATTVARSAVSVGASYIDIANERSAVQGVLDLSTVAQRAGVHLAPASGYGTVATEGLAAWLAHGEAMSSVELALLPDNEGRSQGAFESVLLGLASGGSRVVHGRHRRETLGAGARRLRLPDGSALTLVPADLGDLASIPAGYGASEVTASVGLGIPLLAARLALPAVSLAMRSNRLRARLAARPSTEQEPARRAYLSRSWARVGLPSGESRAGWLSAGEGYRFTAAAVVELARRIADGSARPGARTAIRELGPGFLEGLPGVRLQLSEGRFPDAAAE